MAIRYPTNFPQRINQRVPNMTMDGACAMTGHVHADLGVPSALNATGILNAQSINTAGSSTTFDAAYTSTVEGTMGRWGRNVTVVASGAATSTVTITGRDFLGQAVTETLTLNGTTPVLGAKCFKYVDRVAWALTAATTINVGWGNRLGLPLKAVATALTNELIDNTTAGGAGVLVAGLVNTTTMTATSSDPRGYYTPNASVLPNAARAYQIVYMGDQLNLHGVTHFAA